MSPTQSLLQIPVKLVRLIFRLAFAVMRILLSVFAILIPQNKPQSIVKSSLTNYAKEAWVKSQK